MLAGAYGAATARRVVAAPRPATKPAADTVIATAPAQDRATRPETIRELSGRPGVLITQTVADALKLAEDADVVFVTGSLFVVAEARALL